MNYRMRQMALLLPQNGECVERLLQAREQDSYTASNGALPMAGFGKAFAYAVFPAKSRHTCTALGIMWSPPVSEQSRWRKFSAPFGVESAMRAQPRSAEKIVPAAREKLSACFWRAEDAILYAHFSARTGQPASRRIPPMPRWGQAVLVTRDLLDGKDTSAESAGRGDEQVS